MQEKQGAVRIVWLKVNGSYAVMFGDQLLPINGRILFGYKWQLLDALEDVGLECRDFEGNGIIETPCIPYTPKYKHLT